MNHDQHPESAAGAIAAIVAINDFMAALNARDALRRYSLIYIMEQ